MAIPNVLNQNLPTGGNVLSVPRFEQGQNDLYKQIQQYSANKLKNPLQGFEPIRQNANQNFQRNIIPGVLENFTGRGDNALSSPVLGSQLGAAANQFQGQLAAQEAAYGQQSESNALNAARIGLEPGYENFLQGERPSYYGQTASALLQNAPQLAELGIRGYNWLKGGQPKPSSTPTKSYNGNIWNGVGQAAETLGAAAPAISAGTSALAGFGGALGAAATAAAPVVVPIAAAVGVGYGLYQLVQALIGD